MDLEDPLGKAPSVVSVTNLKRWSQTAPAHHPDHCFTNNNHPLSPFPYNPTLNDRIILW